MTVLNSHDSNSLTFATLTSYLDALQLLPIALFVSFKLPSRPTDMLMSQCVSIPKRRTSHAISVHDIILGLQVQASFIYKPLIFKHHQK
jgi:hypothetical protein